MDRTYRLFSDSYDVKEQWFFALNQIMLHKDFVEQQQQQKIKENLRVSSCQPANAQDDAATQLRNPRQHEDCESSSAGVRKSHTTPQKARDKELAKATNEGLKRDSNWRRVINGESTTKMA